MRAIVWLVILSAAAAPVRAAPPRAHLESLYAEATDLFRQANETAASDRVAAADLYRKAALRFERIVREGGVANGKLYYNIGNAYFRIDDLGRAILYYRRAESYLPNDPNVRQNLEYARARRRDRIEERHRTRILKTLFFWHYDLSGSFKERLFVGFYAIAWILAALRLGVRRSWTAWSAGLSSALAGLMLGSVLLQAAHLRRDRPGVIVAAETVARKGDGASFEPSFREPLHAGTEFRIVEDRGDWLQVELADGRRCWLAAADIERVR